MAQKPTGNTQRFVVTKDQGIRVQMGVLTEGHVQKGGRNPPAATAKPPAPPAQKPVSQSSNATGSQSSAQATTAQPAASPSGNRSQD